MKVELISISNYSIGNTLVSVAMERKKRTSRGRQLIMLMKCVLKCSSMVQPRLALRYSPKSKSFARKDSVSAGRYTGLIK